MYIEHLAIWVRDLEAMRSFYLRYFDLTSNELYHNPRKEFRSYFLSFESGTRLELMHRPDIARLLAQTKEGLGLTHFAISVGSQEKVDELTEKLRSEGFPVVGEPRTTGDGYYESVVLDPEGNRIELTV